MAHAVPSQVRGLIDAIFPDVRNEKPAPGEAGSYPATRVRAVLDQLDRIPEELIRLAPADAALYWANVSALRTAWDDRNTTGNYIQIAPISPSGYRPLPEIFRFLAKCPDEAPTLATRGLEFIADNDFRNSLRTDISTADSALMNHEYKATTVLGGSVVEALLFWALDGLGDANVRKLAKRAPLDTLDKWTLGPMIDAAHACALVTDNTKKQAELAQNYRNLIHPGRAVRVQEKCDRGTALGALAAVEMVATDLAKKFARAAP